MTADALDIEWQRERAWLGYAGLLPFLFGVAVLVFDVDPARRELAVDMLRHYAAVIASFLGAVHWGAAAADPGDRRARHRWGVVPALIAWILLMAPAHVAFAGFAVLFAAILYVDRRLLPLLDDRYRVLRMKLSAIVIVTLLIGSATAARTVS